MFSFINSLWYPENFTQSFTFSKVPHIQIGLYDDSIRSIGLKIIDDKRVYKLNYFKNMDNGLLYMFEEDIRLRFYTDHKIICFDIFSVKHNFNYRHILECDEIEYWKYFRFANKNNNVNYCFLDNIFDYIELESRKRIENKVPFIEKE